MEKLSIGLDFGTLSVRAIALSIESGKVIFSHSSNYENKVIENKLPESSVKLTGKWALQNPKDYIKSLENVLKEISYDMNNSEKNYEIISMGLDFTSCTVLPIDKDGVPLSYYEKYKERPHAWCKLWKHHGAQSQATKINKLAKDSKEKWLENYGGLISSEWLFPKVLQILEEDEEIFDVADRFIEAGDWVVLQLTGNEMRSHTLAGFKSMRIEGEFPDKNFLKKLHPKMSKLPEEKLGDSYHLPTESAGLLEQKYKKILNIDNDVIVSVANIDAHAAVASMPKIDESTMLNSIGTSSCDILLNKEKHLIEGISGIVEDGVIEGFYAYESGQSAVGDIFSWYMENLLPESYYSEAKMIGQNIFDFMESKIKKIEPAETKIIALDWFNGNRSTLMDSELTGLILGLRIDTKPEYIYKALIEATAFGKRKIIDQYEKNGMAIDNLIFMGGLPQKNEELNHIYSDILNKTIIISEYEENAAVGSAIFSSVAAGKEISGFDDVQDAVKILKEHNNIIYPNKENHKKYNILYKEYKILYEYFGKENNVMKNITNI